MTDPWAVHESTKSTDFELSTDPASENKNQYEFEDDFAPETEVHDLIGRQVLPDSQQYLEALERKLQRLKRDPNILRQLTAKREECIRNLLNESLNVDRDGDLALDVPVISGDSAVHEIYRHLRPIQPLSVGETVNIVKHDQLEEQRVLDEGSSEESEPASR